MKLNKKVKTAILSKGISFEDLERWNAFEILKDAATRLHKYHNSKIGIEKIKKLSDFNKWTGVNEKSNKTVKDLINSTINPHFKLWTLLRTDLIPPKILHSFALFFCDDFLNRLKNKNVYIDFKYAKMLEAKKLWIDNKISEGQLKHHQRNISSILAEINGANNKEISAAATCTHSAMNEDPRIAILEVFKAINSIYSVKKENEFRISTITKIITN